MKRRRAHESSHSFGETLADLGMGALGCIAMAMGCYMVLFRSTVEAKTAGPEPPGSPTPAEEEGGPTDHELLGLIAELEKELRGARGRIEEFEDAFGTPQLFGLNGPLSDVVILVDLSGSMVGHDGSWLSRPQPELARRFAEVKQRLAVLIANLRMERFVIVGFGGQTWDLTRPRLETSSDVLVTATSDARRGAIRQLQAWRAIGGTPTLPALRLALDRYEAKHILLLTDGMPTLGGEQPEVLEFLRSDPRPFVLDVIGVGDQTKAAAGPQGSAFLDFTRAMAGSRGGFFQAW